MLLFSVKFGILCCYFVSCWLLNARVIHFMRANGIFAWGDLRSTKVRVARAHLVGGPGEEPPAARKNVQGFLKNADNFDK